MNEKDILGLVFDIHRGTTHDGPGMRTSVFLKGCPLHCSWCHNPESISSLPEISWTQKKCIGCNTCLDACSQKALAFTSKSLLIDYARCNKCHDCCTNCPAHALELTGTYWNVDDLVVEACKDDMFFEDFEGGITISGGEPLSQSSFVKNFAKKLKAAGKHVALDTCGLAPLKAFEEAFPYIDVFLYDLKLWDNDLHKHYTGADNHLILQNFLWLLKKVEENPDKRIWVRTPLIPDITATKANIKALGSFLAENTSPAIERWELCSFNNACRDKYQKLRLDWDFQDEPLMNEFDVNICYELAKDHLPGKVVQSGLVAKND